MRPMLRMSAVAVLAVLGVGLVTPAWADEAKAQVSAATVLSIVAAPVQPRMSAFDEALKRPAPPVPDRNVGEVLEDGSVRYGRAIVTVRNPCPPGTTHFEPPMLPGRRR